MNFKEELEKKTGEVEDILAAYLPKPEGFQSKVITAGAGKRPMWFTGKISP